jgi:ABC-2 type transport system ATP-binding protein
MRRRLDLAASILVRADVYFLDEPTTGLDPASRAQVHTIIRSITADGATVLLTTQYLDEADQLASRVAVIDHGRVVAEGTPGQLKAGVGAGTVSVRLADPEQRPRARQILARLLGVPVQVAADPAALDARVPAGGQVIAALSGLAGQGITVSEFSFGQASLDEVFLALTGHAGTRHEKIPEVTT